jgi:hydrogenase maturation protease
MTGKSAAPVAIGFGNPLRGDDGVGLHVIAGLRDLVARSPGALPPGTRLVAAGPASLDLLAIVRDASALLLIDALDVGRRPGSVEVFDTDRVEAAAGRGALGDLLLAGRLLDWLPESLALVGVEVATTEVGAGLSAAVEAAIPAAVSLSRLELTRLTTMTRTLGACAARTARPAGGVYA